MERVLVEPGKTGIDIAPQALRVDSMSAMMDISQIDQAGHASGTAALRVLHAVESSR